MNLSSRYPCILRLSILLAVFFVLFSSSRFPFPIFPKISGSALGTLPADRRPSQIGHLALSHNRSGYLAILILSSPTSAGRARRRAIRETWLRLHDDGVFYRFVIGGQNLDSNLTQEFETESDDVLILDDVVDSYANLSRKVLSMFAWTYEHVDFRYALKVNDDSFVRLDVLYRELKQMTHPQKSRLYWGYFYGHSPVLKKGKWAEKDWILCDRYLPYALVGGYILSWLLVEYLAKNKDLLKLYKSEDVSVGAWLAGLDIYYKHDIRFDTEWKSRGCRNYFLITHKQSKESMRRKYKILVRTGHLCEKEHSILHPFEYNWANKASKCCQRNSSL